MERKLQQRVVGILVLAAAVLLIAPVLFDAEGRIPVQITQIPPKPKVPDLSNLPSPESAFETRVEAGDALVATEPVEAAQPVVAEPPASAPIAVPASSSATQSRLWSVQVASFREIDKANVLRDQLRAAEFETYIRKKLLSDGTIFTQVFVGPVPTKQVADRLNGLVKTKFSLQGLIVRYRE
ncbi:SPOR domain-containing protein [Reinekea sp.]|uniref:SPOR domain-containing protein n=1 Tax=Reinekea sp. TaxID=1970455 RepID=UPI00257DCE28|nr:SPOR domain-containing protein [Reinekea sp.]